MIKQMEDKEEPTTASRSEERVRAAITSHAWGIDMSMERMQAAVRLSLSNGADDSLDSAARTNVPASSNQTPLNVLIQPCLTGLHL